MAEMGFHSPLLAVLFYHIFIFIFSFWHTSKLCTILGPNCTFFSFNRTEKLQTFPDLGHSLLLGSNAGSHILIKTFWSSFRIVPLG